MIEQNTGSQDQSSRKTCQDPHRQRGSTMPDSLRCMSDSPRPGPVLSHSLNRHLDLLYATIHLGPDPAFSALSRSPCRRHDRPKPSRRCDVLPLHVQNQISFPSTVRPPARPPLCSSSWSFPDLTPSLLLVGLHPMPYPSPSSS